MVLVEFGWDGGYPSDEGDGSGTVSGSNVYGVMSSIVSAPSPLSNDYFGRSVAMSAEGDVIAVGAPGSDASGVSDSMVAWLVSIMKMLVIATISFFLLLLWAAYRHPVQCWWRVAV